MQTLALTNVERVQHEQTLDVSHVGLGNTYASIQQKYRDLVGGELQQDEENYKQYLRESVGEQLAASGQTGRSAERIASLDLADYLKKGSRATYELTQARRDLGEAASQAAGQARQQQMASFAKNNIVKSPDIAPPQPVLQNVGQAAFMDALSIGTKIAGVYTGGVAAGAWKAL